LASIIVEAAVKFRRSQVPALPIAATFALALLAASALVHDARAFTIEDKAPGASGDNAANLADPNDRLTSRFNNGKQTIIKQGDATIYFGGQPQSFDQRYNSNNLFDRNGRPGDLYGR
jgi:hypothetical protein